MRVGRAVQRYNFPAVPSDFWHWFGTARFCTDGRILLCGSRNVFRRSLRLFGFVLEGLILLGILNTKAGEGELLRLRYRSESRRAG